MNPVALSFSSPAYNGFKNNDYESGSITLSGSIAGSGTLSVASIIALSRDNSVAQPYFTTNRVAQANLYIVGETYYLPPIITYSTGTTTGFPGDAPYSVQFFTNFQPTQVTITANILNPYSTTLSNIDAVYNLQVFTFIAPFLL